MAWQAIKAADLIPRQVICVHGHAAEVQSVEVDWVSTHLCGVRDDGVRFDEVIPSTCEVLISAG